METYRREDSLLPLKVTVEEVLRYMGSSPGRGLSSAVASSAEEAKGTVEKNCLPRSLWAVFPLEQEKEELFLEEEGNRLKLGLDNDFFQGARQAALSVITLGEEISLRIQERFGSGDYMEAYVLDAAACVVLEKAGKQLFTSLNDFFRDKGLLMGYPVSPGCPWLPMEAQKTIFSLLPAAEIGVSLNDSLIMSPLKSTSYAIPAGEDLSLPYDGKSLCFLCSRRQQCISARYW